MKQTPASLVFHSAHHDICKMQGMIFPHNTYVSYHANIPDVHQIRINERDHISSIHITWLEPTIRQPTTSLVHFIITSTWCVLNKSLAWSQRHKTRLKASRRVFCPPLELLWYLKSPAMDTTCSILLWRHWLGQNKKVCIIKMEYHGTLSKA